MTVETSIDALEAQTGLLLDTVTTIRDGLTAEIAAAVALSVNETISPLFTLTTNSASLQLAILQQHGVST